MGDERREVSKPGTNTKSTSAARAVLAAVRQCWPNAQVDPQDRTGVWENAIAGLTAAQMQHGLRELSLLTDAFPPTPGAFRALCVAYRAPEPEPPRRIPDNSERGRAWRACQIAFAKKVTGMVPPGPHPSTDFNVDLVVGNAPIPKTSALVEHTRRWDALKRRFDEAWGLH